MHCIREDVLCVYVFPRLQSRSQQAQQNEEKLLKRLMGATDRERNAAKKKKELDAKIQQPLDRLNQLFCVIIESHR